MQDIARARRLRRPLQISAVKGKGGRKGKDSNDKCGKGKSLLKQAENEDAKKWAEKHKDLLSEERSHQVRLQTRTA